MDGNHFGPNAFISERVQLGRFGPPVRLREFTLVWQDASVQNLGVAATSAMSPVPSGFGEPPRSSAPLAKE